ncbi:MAG TPA: methyltransferase domain-containing protein [Terracidiphilus sp.]
MSAQATISPTIDPVSQLKSRLKQTWMTGDYDIFSRYMEPDAHLFYRRVGAQPGQKLLDVGCGTGQLALIAARAGVETTGCDIAPNWLACARERAKQEHLNVRFEEGDVEALPYADGQFDVVASLVGAMFAPRPELAASEMIRVCRPGGRIVMANWTAEGFIGKMLKLIASYVAPNGMPSPLLWGDEATVRGRFSEGVLDVRCALRFYQFKYPFPPEMVVDFFREKYGPMARAFDSLGAEEQAQLHAKLVALWAGHNRATGSGTLVDAEYLEVIAIRGEKTATIFGKQAEESAPRNRRAELLADRLEEGAARLSDFAGQLTDAEWKTRVTEAGKPGRTVGNIVHHVASVYPIEVDLACLIASGQPVVNVTWAAVNKMNAEHAGKHGGASKEETLELLRNNAAEAAARVRRLTDAELDRAAPFSLSAGAQMTAQFVLEDHAVRHSLHHLAKVCEALDGHGGNPTVPRG